MEPKTRYSTIILLCAGALLANSGACAEVYRWVDENGEVHYSETLPPDFEDKGHDILNERGIVLDEDKLLTPPPPPEKPKEEVVTELPRDTSGLPRPKPLYSDMELQNRMDNFLMLRYESEQEITDAMNVEIKQLDYDRRLLATTRQSMQDSYRGQVKSAAHKQRSGQQVDPAVARQIGVLQTTLADNIHALDGLQVREENIRQQFGEQLDRYRYLIEKWAEEEEEG